MLDNMVFVGNNIFNRTKEKVRGSIVAIENEKYYKISGCDQMPPFLMNVVSESDIWMFIASNGALTAGRKNPDNALFPYYTDDRIYDSNEITGSKTILFVTSGSKTFLWEPFSNNFNGLYRIERSVYKNVSGNKVIFEEINKDLSVTFQWSWASCGRFGIIKKSKIINDNDKPVFINILDGIQNILPSGADRKFQLEYSTLLDAYKKNELIEETSLGLFTLSSIPTDKAEPSEALKATVVWSTGLKNATILLSSEQLDLFRKEKAVSLETETRAVRGAYFLQSDFDLSGKGSRQWYLVADLNKDQADVADLSEFIRTKTDLALQLEMEIRKSSDELNQKISAADGYQLTNDNLVTARHFSNVTFNIMRGGILENNYLIPVADFELFVKKANKPLAGKYKTVFEKLAPNVNLSELLETAAGCDDPDFERLCYEYLPLTFSRRHGDPSRPWNIFSIDIKDEQGIKILNYQGNWRDIFQNWEALSVSFPGFIENMIVKFVNSSTADGYNPYRVVKNGFEWEVLDPNDSWSFIGYWGDHQVVYLQRLLEQSVKYHPDILKSFLKREIFTYANVPYRIKSYEQIQKDPHNTISFDAKLDSEISRLVEQTGSDGKYLRDESGEIYRVNLTEKLLVVMLVKLSNFIPGAGIWMNTQRPEWNDANNALVGFGASMVTLYQLRSFISFCAKLFTGQSENQFEISAELGALLDALTLTFNKYKYLLDEEISGTERKNITDELGNAGSQHRLKIYSDGFSGEKNKITKDYLAGFFALAIKFLDHSIERNKRDDNLFHSYNLIKIEENGSISIRNLYEMLEGQVAILSSGYLDPEESVELLKSLRNSSLYRKDQNSYILYPERKLAGFTEKNIITDDLISKSKLLKKMVTEKDRSIIYKDIRGFIHFNSKFRNSSVLKESLSGNGNGHKIAGEEIKNILDIYESVFDHQSFTGRSGTFYKYEGLGSIYWHMVSKLLLAIQETYYRAVRTGYSLSIPDKLKEAYYEIQDGIGCHKEPEQYGAFPTDPYSHTPVKMGAQQPGMTGQVKEDIISRFGELGIIVSNGRISFDFGLLNRSEFLVKSQAFNYYDVSGNYQSLVLNPGMLAFTFCQVPIVYIMSDEEGIIITDKNDAEEEISDLVIDESYSKTIFLREGKVKKIKVLFNKLNTKKL